MLCSTPSVAVKSRCITQEPSMSEISFSDENEDSVFKSDSCGNDINLQPNKAKSLLFQNKFSTNQHCVPEDDKASPSQACNIPSLPQIKTSGLNNECMPSSCIKTKSRYCYSCKHTESMPVEDSFSKLSNRIVGSRNTISQFNNDHGNTPNNISDSIKLVLDSSRNSNCVHRSSLKRFSQKMSEESLLPSYSVGALLNVPEDIGSSTQKVEFKQQELKENGILVHPTVVQHYLQKKQVPNNLSGDGSYTEDSDMSKIIDKGTDDFLTQNNLVIEVKIGKCKEKRMVKVTQPIVMLHHCDTQNIKKRNTGKPAECDGVVIEPPQSNKDFSWEECTQEKNNSVVTSPRLQESATHNDDEKLKFLQAVVILHSSEVPKKMEEIKVETKMSCKDTTRKSLSSETGCEQSFSLIKKKSAEKTRTNSLLKDPCGTSRQACISGLGSSRWVKKGSQRSSHLIQRGKYVDNSLIDLHANGTQNCAKILENKLGHNIDDFESMIPVKTNENSPLPSSFFNSSAFYNFVVDSTLLKSSSWSRVKAALSVHKKKRAVPSPCRSPMKYLRRNKKSAVYEVLTGEPQTPIARRGLNISRRSISLEWSTLRGLTPVKCLPSCEEISDAEKVYHECQQDGPISFEECIPESKMKECVKIGEGVFGEVFRTINDENECVALKIIPIEGNKAVNGEPQKTFGEMLPEIIISKELSILCEQEENRTDGFIALHSIHCVKGCYPEQLLQAWHNFDKTKGSENDCPDIFDDEQLFMILEFEFGGSDLENMKTQLSSIKTAKSILHQVTASLAVAEQSLQFEHRDLHWGNILIKKTNLKMIHYTLNGTTHEIEACSIQVNIIDYTLSRLEKDGLTVFCDISTDEDLFQGQGDYQFDIYRKMREENLNKWNEYNPYSNVLWLHYLADKLLNSIVYKSKCCTAPQKAIQKSMKKFLKEVLNFSSATEVLSCSTLFQ
nr:PREDICTED: serine/threonine-protein kinase haspin [Latimeria chalumnae]|eukprot:XP_014340726.1 PREDICTED: serine/threonine-protein kinase haspin [Latimeria chalumnae]